MDRNMEDGVERLIKHIRRMSLLTDEQLRSIINHAITNNPDSYMGIGTDIEGYIAYIRNMSKLTDDQIRHAFKDSANDPVMREIFEDAAKKKALLEMQKIAKDIKGDPKRFARRVDDL
jgi:hypothetical protein